MVLKLPITLVIFACYPIVSGLGRIIGDDSNLYSYHYGDGTSTNNNKDQFGYPMPLSMSTLPLLPKLRDHKGSLNITRSHFDNGYHHFYGQDYKSFDTFDEERNPKMSLRPHHRLKSGHKRQKHYKTKGYPQNPKSTPKFPYVKKQSSQMEMEKCNGKMNMVDDIGIISLILSTFATFVGFGLDLVLTFTANTIAIITTIFALLIGIPNAIITALGLSDPFFYWLANGLNVLSFAVTFFGATSLEIGNFGLLVDAFFEVLGVYGLIISLFGTFPVLFDDLIEFCYTWGGVVVGNEVKHFIENYGCHNSYVPGMFL